VNETVVNEVVEKPADDTTGSAVSPCGPVRGVCRKVVGPCAPCEEVIEPCVPKGVRPCVRCVPCAPVCKPCLRICVPCVRPCFVFCRFGCF
ncbi:MAG: hypothetical protein Q4C47_08625, partial [Planctomycetia bacterium]|nr:hypothetical protein [Planctomycetia bacterium]